MANKWIPSVEMVNPSKWAAMAYNHDGTDRKFVRVPDSDKPKYFESELEAKVEARKLANILNMDPIIFVPTREEVENLKVGDLALDPFGRMRHVAMISYRGIDVNSRSYVGYYVEFGDLAWISNSMKEGKLVRTCALSARYTSRELDDIERRINQERMAAMEGR